MKRKKFASRLCNYMEDRVIEICGKFQDGNVNMASLPAFWMGLEGDINTFLMENNLWIRKSINNHPTKQTVQKGSGDELSGNLKRSGGSTEVKTDDIIMTGCLDELEDVYDS